MLIAISETKRLLSAIIIIIFKFIFILILIYFDLNFLPCDSYINSFYLNILPIIIYDILNKRRCRIC
jgi:hypothetical protein